MNRCSGCQKNFRSVGAFDMHRIGSFGEALYNAKGKSIGQGKSQRRCKTTEEMLAEGMQQDDKGTWRGPASAGFSYASTEVSEEIA